MAIEGLLHHFGVKTKAHKEKLHQRLAESQVAYADLVKDVHELCQFSIMKIAACTSHLNSRDHEMQNYCTSVVNAQYLRGMQNWIRLVVLGALMTFEL